MKFLFSKKLLHPLSERVGVVVVALCFLSSGCASMQRQPKALDALYRSYETERVARYQNPNSAAVRIASASAAARNDLMNDLILFIDHNYGDIEKSLYGHKSWADFSGSVLATGLSTASTLSGSLGTKTTLSALVTAIEATKTSFNKDILQSQGVLAIIAQMRKMRSEKLLQIRFSQKRGIAAYPLSMGLDDLMEYYQAGTFVHALQALTEDASASKKVADEQLTSLKTGGQIPPKITTTHTTTVVIPPAETGAAGARGAASSTSKAESSTTSTTSPATSAVSSSEPEKTRPAHPAGIIESAQ